MPVRIVQTGFTDDEWSKVAVWIAKKEGITLYELLKRATLEYIDRFQGQDPADLPKVITLLTEDLKKFQRLNFDHLSNVRWLRSRHGVTEGTAKEALRIYETENLIL